MRNSMIQCFQTLLVLILGISATLAQTTTPEPRELDEVLVTAQRRLTTVQDTPIAVSVIGATEIQEERLINLNDIAARMPSITFNQVNHSEAFISIRGTTIGNDAAGIDQGVSVFIDDVPTIGFGDNSPDLYDLQSIEVLRGPQGTLFGRNVTGGAILIHSLPPSFTSAARATITYGSNNLMEAQGYLTGPIFGDTLAGKLAIDIRRRDDFLNNVTLNDKTYGENLGSIRGQILWRPADKLDITFGGDYLSDSSHNKAQFLVGNFQPSLFPPLSYSPDNTNQGLNTQSTRTIGGILAHVDWRLPFATLTSVTGERRVDSNLLYSTQGDPSNSFISQPVVADDQISQEIRLVSPADKRLTWVGGIFALTSNRAYLQSQFIDAFPGTRLNFLGSIIPALARFESPYTNHANQHVTLVSEALFGEATFAFTDDLKFTVGGRYSRERKYGHTEIFDTSVTNPNLNSGPYSRTWSAFTPKFLLSFEPIENLLTYASVTKGFESGGYDTNGTTAAGLASPYNPEYVWSYEVGAKSTFFSKRMHVNLAAYDAQYTDLQTRNYDPISSTIVAGNAARARTRGIELDADALPTEWLRLGLTYSYSDAKYGRYVTPNSSGPPTDYSGHIIPYTPRSAVNLNGEVQFAAPKSRGTIKLGGDVTYRTAIQFDDANDTPAFIIQKTPYRGVLNLHASWLAEGEKYEVTLWGRNVTNHRSIIDNFDFSNFYDTFAEYQSGGYVSINNWTDPRTIGVSLTGRY